MTRAPRKVAVIAPNWLGDAVMSLPAVAELKRAGRAVAVLAAPYVARVYALHPDVDELWIDTTGGRMQRLRARTASLAAYRADEALVLPPSFSAALPPFLAGVKRRAGFPTDGRGLFLTHRTGPLSRDVHMSISYMNAARRLLERADAARDGTLPEAPGLTLSDAERARARDLLDDAGVRGDYVVVVPGAAFGPAKTWPRERYRALCEKLGADVPVVLVGSAGDAPVATAIASGVARVANLTGRTSLGELFAVLESARVVVANDSGAPHVSAALGVPTVVLFGSTSPAWTRPLGARVDVLQHVVHCNPCFRRDCPTQLECFNGIAVEQVRDAVVQALGRRPDSGRRAAGGSDMMAGRADPPTGRRHSE